MDKFYYNFLSSLYSLLCNSLEPQFGFFLNQSYNCKNTLSLSYEEPILRVFIMGSVSIINIYFLYGNAYRKY